MKSNLLPAMTNFTDMVIKDKHPYMGEQVLCPVCHGYGGSVLRVDAYGKGKHFMCFCSQCNGWGWVKAGSQDATCAHEWSSEGIGNCLHLWTCKKCGQQREVDSSG